MKNVIYDSLVALANWYAYKTGFDESLLDWLASCFEPVEKADPRECNIR
tara:strand:+ start:936 stop:1082 length:147 start_codon:yes stop_codon:yes gene_type:complete